MFGNRKIWSSEETKGLLLCYLEHKDEFKHRRQKRNAYANVLEDMIARGFTDSSTPILALEGRIRTLLDSFKLTKNRPEGNEVPASLAPYWDLMELIFGDGDTTENKHTLHIGSESVEYIKIDSYTYKNDPLEAGDSPKSPCTSPYKTIDVSKKRKLDREAYYDAKLELKKQLANALLEQQNEFFTKLISLQERKVKLLEEALKK